MKVNRNNYEVFMIDYFDGKLNASEIDELLVFIEFHPDIKEEFEIFDHKPLYAEEIIFTKKSELKRTPVLAHKEINEDNFENYFIDFFENDLGISQKEDLKTFLHKNPHLQKEFILHSSLILKTDHSVVYKNKESLKRKRKLGVYWWSGAAAAVIIILFGVFGLLKQNVSPPLDDYKSFVISRLGSQSIDSKISTSRVDLNISERALPTAINIEVALTAEADLPERITIGKMQISNPNLVLAKQDQFSPIIPEYSDNFDDVYALAETPQEPKKKKSAFGRVIKNLAGRASANSDSKDSKGKNKKDPTFVRVLDQSILVFNTITGSDTEMVKSYDENGNLKHYEVDGETLSWSKNISAGSPNAQ